MDYTYNHCFVKKHAYDIYNICPACCGVKFKEMTASEINRLCIHHQHKRVIKLSKIYEKQEQDFIEEQERIRIAEESRLKRFAANKKRLAVAV